MRSIDVRDALIDLGYQPTLEPYERVTVIRVAKDAELVEILRMEDGEVFHEFGEPINPAYDVPGLTDAEDVAEVIHQGIMLMTQQRERRKAHRQQQNVRTDT